MIFPQAYICTVCGRILKEYNKFFLCASCLSQIKIVNNQEEINGRVFLNNPLKDTGLSIAFDKCYSVCLYEGIVRSMVHGLKYKDKRETAFTMAAMMADILKDEKARYNIIVPIPASEKRLKRRGYNQAELIGTELANLLKIPVKSILRKVRDTPSQVLYSSGSRWYNVMDAFECEIELKGISVLLVDDVITTGATAHYCAKELKARGAGIVHVISFAKSIL